MILNRPYIQWTATAAAIINVAALTLLASGIRVDPALVAAANAAVAAVLALIANATTVGTRLYRVLARR
jgi:uncharacterized phage protein gp47/JayE